MLLWGLSTLISRSDKDAGRYEIEPSMASIAAGIDEYIAKLLTDAINKAIKSSIDAMKY